MSLQSGGMVFVTSLSNQMKWGNVLWKNSMSSWRPSTSPLVFDRIWILWDSFVIYLQIIKDLFLEMVLKVPRLSYWLQKQMMKYVQFNWQLEIDQNSNYQLGNGTFWTHS